MKEQLKKAKAIIEGYDGPAVRVMEVCGTHTHEIFHLGVRKILPPQVELISGPGCPVCVTPAGFIDEAVWLALEKNVTICTFGDLVRVPGSTKSLADARSLGGKIQMVYSPMDAFEYAKEHKDEQVVFLSVGFETTTPASCLSVKMAKEAGLTNYAEAYYWSKEETLAKIWLNKVRERAGLGDWSGSDLRQGIYDERLHEFMQEGLRWQDLLRMYDRMEMLEHFSAINSNFSLKDLLLPIPYNERILNPEGLYQNPGYGSN